MDKKIVRINVIWEDNYGAYCELLPGCVAVHDTLSGVKKGIISAIEFHLEGMREDGDDIPEVFLGEYEFEFKLNVKALMERYKGVLTPAGLERLTGINKRQLQHYSTGLHNPFPTQRKKIERALHAFGKELQEVEL